MQEITITVKPVPDWQATGLLYGIGSTPAQSGDPEFDPYRTGNTYFSRDADNLARSGVLTPFIELLKQHPKATHVVAERFAIERTGPGDITYFEHGYANAILKVPGADDLVIHEQQWPCHVDKNMWQSFELDDGKVNITLSQSDVEFFTVNGVTSIAPLAEIIQLYHEYNDLEKCSRHIRATFGGDRVSLGRSPQRWGAPGLRRIDDYLAHGGSPSATDACGATPIAAALYLRQEDIVRKLADAGANINAPAYGGLYPIDVAVISGSKEIICLCAELGASANTVGYQQPLFRTIDLRSTELFELMIDLGANVGAETANGVSVTQYIEAAGGTKQSTFMSILTSKIVAATIDLEAPASNAPRRIKSIPL